MCEANKKVLYEKGDPLLKELTCAVVFSEEEFSGLISQSDTLAWNLEVNHSCGRERSGQKELWHGFSNSQRS